MPPFRDISYGKFNADAESNDSSDLDGAEGKAPFSLKHTEFSMNQFAKSVGQSNLSSFNKWKKLWVAGFLEKMHQSLILGQNRLTQLRDEPLNWETAVADFLETLATWLPFGNIDKAEWIQ